MERENSEKFCNVNVNVNVILLDGGWPKSDITYSNDIEPTNQFDRFNSCDWCICNMFNVYQCYNVSFCITNLIIQMKNEIWKTVENSGAKAKQSSAQFKIRMSYKFENIVPISNIWTEAQVKCQANIAIFSIIFSNWILNAEIGIHMRQNMVKYFHSLKFMVH